MGNQTFILNDSFLRRIAFLDNSLPFECFLHPPPMTVHDCNLMDDQWIFHKENMTNKLLRCIHKYPDQYSNEVLDDKEINSMSHQVITAIQNRKILLPTP